MFERYKMLKAGLGDTNSRLGRLAMFLSMRQAAESSAVLRAIIEAVIAAVVGLALMPTVFNFVSTITNNANYTGNSHLTGTITLVYVLDVIYVIVVFVAMVGRIWQVMRD